MAAKSRRRRLADLFGRRPDSSAAMQLQLAPRRLEPRRMLDAGAAAVALEMLDVSSDYVQAGSDYAPLALSSSDAAGDVNSPPANIQIQPLGAIDENGIATLELVFDDANPNDSHTVAVDWGDGPIEFFNVPVGSQFFGTTHQYLDDDPSVTSSDIYTVNVKVVDSAGGAANASAPLTVNNVAPSNLQIAPPSPINENGIGSLELIFDDPGSLDSHTVEVNWGDGNIEVFNVPQGSRFFGTTHQYLDDDPSGTSADDYAINVRVLDDDGGEITGSTKINVSNLAPSNLQLAPIADVNENGFAQLSLTFDDPGTLDTHKVEVDWGDGNIETLDVTPGDRVFSTTHHYLDDNPTGTPSDLYTVKVRLLDDDLGEIAAAPATVRVHNVAPSGVTIDPLAPIDENGVALLHLTFADPGSLDGHTVEIDWGDGSALDVLPVSAGARAFTASHQYLDDNPTGTSADAYAIKVRVLDDDGGVAIASSVVTVNNVPPQIIVAVPAFSTTTEGNPVSLLILFVDQGSQDTHTFEVDWGDGVVTAGSAPVPVVGPDHIYADNGVYTIHVKVVDDDGGVATSMTQVTVTNVAPTVAPTGSQTVNEGQQLSLVDIATFTDPGFNSPLNVLDPSNGGETAETFSYTINWGDGTAVDAGVPTIDAVGGPGMPTGGSFDGQHTYADNGVYTVTITVADDDLGATTSSFTVTVDNVSPTLTVMGNQSIDEGSQLSLVNIGSFTDPGFDNPLNPAPGETAETFTYSINWGDGTPATVGAATIDSAGGVGIPTAGSFDGQHTYADNGVYTVIVTVFDDDGGQDQGTFTVTVANVSPSLTAAGNRSIDEGSVLSVSNIGVFTDPGFNNPLNPLPGGETTETFTYTINWGDGTAVNMGAATVDTLGSPGTPTAGSFDGQHTYADNGVYTVTVTVFDDDAGQHQRSFQVTVQNVAPTLNVVANQIVNEGSLLSLTNIGTFTDPGFNNPLNAGNVASGGETTETFTFAINWGDGTGTDTGAATIDLPGGVGTLTSGSFDGSHTYADNGLYTVTVTVFDDDGGEQQRAFTVQVNNVAPTLTVITDRATNEGALLSITNLGVLSDPGFDNPNNPVPGGELVETFTYTIDWGDGTAIDAGPATVDALGSPGVLTAASFDGAHTYADDGLYTVTVTVLDDDGGQAVRTFLVTIGNVAPTLKLTVNESLIDAIDEGGTTQVNITGLFRDPGFDNPNNTAPGLAGAPAETSEIFTYEVDWGDGHTTGPIALADLNGSPGVDSTGSIAQFFTHQYVDNDLDGVRDARYTVTVTVFDDDGGEHSQTFEVIVYNTNPVLQPIAATDVNTNGETTLTLSFDDLGAPGFETFEILIDWGDQLTVADPIERFVVESSYDGSTPNTFAFTHTYTGPPDPLHPAADIVISVKVRDDDFGTATSRPDADPITIDGQSNIEVVAITNPGIGAEEFRIDTTPQVALLTFPESVIPALDLVSAEARGNGAVNADEGGAAGDSRAASERYLELRVINPDGTMSEGYRLRSEVLSNLKALFRNLPDNRYQIYLVQSETNVRRLVIEVFVRNGKVIDPGDDSEGARDRPPTDETTTAPGEALPETLPAADDEPATSSKVEPMPEHPRSSVSSTAIYHRTTLAGVALALSGAGLNWQRQMEQTLIKARPSEWKRLRTAGHRRRRKPR